MFHHFSGETKADELWEKIQNMYWKKSSINKSFALKQIIRLRYKDGASMNEHLSSFQGLLNQAVNVGLKLDDEVQTLLLFSSLPDSWDTLLVSISNSTQDGVLTLDQVKEALMNEEVRRKEQSIESESQALVTKKSDRRGRSKSRGPRDRNDKSRGRSKSKKDVMCYHSQGNGHFKRECRVLKRELAARKGKGKKDESSDDDTTAMVPTNDVFVYCDDVNVTSHDSDWFW